MSGIFGSISLDGSPPRTEDLQRMLAAMAYWGPDGRGISVHGIAGLGHLKLLATPEARAEQLPLLDPESGFAFTASARLDDRDELCDRLGIPPRERADTADTSLLLKAWLRWGEAALPGLRGDWCFALWDPRERRLVLARDPYGQTALYHTTSPQRFAFASCQKALLALPEVPRDLDQLRLAQILTSWPGDGVATAYQAIRRLPPAHFLICQDGQTRIQQYWRMEDAPAVRLGSDAAYVEAFLELFTRAVRSRLRRVRPIGSSLSGGLDSGSVTALAARELGDAALTALTSVPLYPPDGAGPGRFGDEWPLAHQVAQRWPTITHLPIRAEHIGPLQGIEWQLWIHDEPGHAASNQYWIAAMLETARAQGLGVLLTGQMGNGGVSWIGSRYRPWKYLMAGEVSRAIREATAWKREQRQSWIGTLRSQLLRPTIGPFWDLRHRLRGPIAPPWQAYSAIHPDFAKEMNLGHRMEAAGHDPTFAERLEPLAGRFAILQPGRAIAGALWCEAGAAYGLEVRDPTADVRLLEFCLGCPDDQFSQQGKDRWLIRRAMQGILPAEIQWNRDHGLQAADLGHRLRQEVPACADWLRRMEHLEKIHKLLNLKRLTDVLENLSQTIEQGNTAQAGMVLCRGIGVGRFILGQADSRCTWTAQIF